MRKIVITTLTAAICVAPFAMSTAVAGDIGGLRQQLHHDQHARHDARAKLDADIRNGNTAAIAGDRAALAAARDKVHADREQLRAQHAGPPPPPVPGSPFGPLRFAI